MASRFARNKYRGAVRARERPASAPSRVRGTQHLETISPRTLARGARLGMRSCREELASRDAAALAGDFREPITLIALRINSFSSMQCSITDNLTDGA